MELNGTELNGTEINGILSGVAGIPPVGQWYMAEVVAMTSFTGFTSFVSGAVGTRLFGNVPTNTDVRVGVRFISAGSIMRFEVVNRVWSTYVVGNEALLPSLDDVLNITPSEWVKAGGFNPSTPRLQWVIFLRTDTSSSTPSVTSAQVVYLQGSQSEIIDAINLPSAVPVLTKANLDAGMWIFDTINGYRLDSNSTDNGNIISGMIETQAVQLSSNETIYQEVFVELDSSASTIVTVTVIVDKAEQTPTLLSVTSGVRKYVVGVNCDSPAMFIRARVEWTDTTIVIKSVRIVGEAMQDQVS